MNTTRRCSLCKQVKPMTDFSRHRGMSGGRDYWCKVCVRKRTRAYSKTPSGIYTRIKARTKFLQKKPLKISREDFVNWYNKQPKKCGYCGLSAQDIKKIWKMKRMRFGSLTIDCKDNLLGYIKGNIILCCDKCNIVKNDILTYEEMCFVGQNFIRLKWDKLLKTHEQRVRETGEAGSQVP